jgi:hypothetical protein
MAAFSDEVFEATQRLLKAQQELTRAVLGRAVQEAIARDEEPAGGHDRDDDELADEPLVEADEADDVGEDETDDEPVDEADGVEDEHDDVEDVTDDEAVDVVEDEPDIEDEPDVVEDEPDDEAVDEADDFVQDEPETETDELEDTTDDEPVDEADNVEDEPPVGRIVPARAKAAAPAAAKRSTRGRRRSA